jgi:hypothetical protein
LGGYDWRSEEVYGGMNLFTFTFITFMKHCFGGGYFLDYALSVVGGHLSCYIVVMKTYFLVLCMMCSVLSMFGIEKCSSLSTYSIACVILA